MRINLKRPSPTLATAAVLLASAAAVPVAFAALPSLASTASTVHLAALGCSRAEVCTTAVAADTTAPDTVSTNHAFYPIGQENAVLSDSRPDPLDLAKPTYMCQNVCMHN